MKRIHVGCKPYLSSAVVNNVQKNNYYLPHCHAKHKMQPVAVDVAWSVWVSVDVSFCLLIMTMNCAKTAELIEMLFGFGLGWAQGTTCLVGAHISPGKGAIMLFFCPIRNAL